MADLYIDRPTDWTGHPRGPARSLATRLEMRLLSARDGIKIFFTGQVGSGKSSELRRLWQSQAIANHFERLRFVASEEPLDVFEADIQQFLVALAASLARHIARANYHHSHTWSPSERIDKQLHKWITLLTKAYEVVPPDPGEDPTIQFGTIFMKFSAKLRSEASLRARVRSDDAFGVVELRGLVGDLLTLIHKAAGRPLLVIFDDLDKLSASAASDIFIAHAEELQRLRCSAVITYPYVLHYGGQLHAAVTSPVVLESIKTITREAPTDPLPTAIAFFTELLAHRVERSIVTPEAIALAVRYCAGIPREFLRIIHQACLIADEYGQEGVGIEDVQAAVRASLRHLTRATQSEPTRQALMRIHKTRRLDGASDWELVQALLAVEYTNDQPWYDVHPILVEYVERLMTEAAASPP